MTIGGSITLIVIGAILTFAVEYDPQYLNLDAMGIILMIGGAIGLVFGLIWAGRTTTTVTRADGGERTTTREHPPH